MPSESNLLGLNQRWDCHHVTRRFIQIGIQSPFNKYRDWFAESSTNRWMGVRPVGSVEVSPTPLRRPLVQSPACMCWERVWIFVTYEFLWCRRARMDRNVVQRYAMKFCFKLGKSASESFEIIGQAYGDDALIRTRVFEWHKMFKEDRKLVEDARRPLEPKLVLSK